MKKLKTYLLFILILTIGHTAVFSQQKKSNEDERLIPVLEKVDNSNRENPGIELDRKLEKNIREERTMGNKSAAEALQNQLMSKNKVKKDESEIKKVSPVNGNLFNSQNDNSNNTNISLVDSVSYISIQSAVSEQTGNTKGRLWNIYMISTNTQDTVKIKYSDDNGINWNHFASYIWSYPDFDTYAMNMDADIVINTSNEKMLHIIFSCYDGSDRRIGIVRVDVGHNPGLCSQQLFSFGSFSTTLQYQVPKVTSDNAIYSYLPYIFISAVEYNTYDGTSKLKFAMMINPFDIYGIIQYSNATLVHLTYNDTFDFCSFNINFDDYVCFTIINLSGSNILYTTQYKVSDAIAGNPIYSLSSIYSSKLLRLPSIASDGRKFVIACEYVFTTSDYDIKYFYSPGGGVSALYDAGYIDNSLLFDCKPMTTAEWNTGKFSCAFEKRNFSGYISIHLSSTNNFLFDNKSKMISTDEINSFLPLSFAIPLITTSGECFITWTDFGNNQQIYSATGCSGTIEITKTLELKLFMEGFYRQNTNQLEIQDTVKVYLRKYTSPFNIIDSAKGPISKSGIVNLNFRNAQNGVNYFIVAKHRNSIETWSDPDGVMFESNSLSFDFSLSNGQAYGANQRQIDQTPITYAIFSGDVNQDGLVDLSDIVFINNDVNDFASGYKVSDLTGDNLTDLTDLILGYNNSSAFAALVRP